MKDLEMTTENTIQQLEVAVSTGDVKSAQTLIALLTKQKQLIKIDLIPRIAADNGYYINISIEDRFMSAKPFRIKIHSQTTVGELKKLVCLKHHFPVQVQRLIVSQKIPKDRDVLSKHGVREGSTVYIYMVPAPKVNLTKEQFQEELSLISFGGPQSNPHLSMSNLELSSIHVSGPKPAIVSNMPHQVFYQGMNVGASHSFPSPKPVEQEKIGWKCPSCTYINLPHRPGCEMCTNTRPSDYQIPDNYEMSSKEIDWRKMEDDALLAHKQLEAKERDRNRQALLDTAQLSLVVNPEPFTCPICLDDIPKSKGVILQECLHSFCKDCLVHSICLNESGDIRCLYQDIDYQCNAKVQESVIKALVPDDVYQRYLNIGLRLAESAIPNSYHCKTPNCQGWCIYEDDVNFFDCPVCNRSNCLTCKAIHEGQNCKEFQAELDKTSLNNSEAKRTKKLLEGMLKTGEAMRCPRCDVILSKKDGCDWLCCSICKLEICWATKGPRWGPAGAGDLSAGCRCNVDQVKCHPKCLNCH